MEDLTTLVNEGHVRLCCPACGSTKWEHSSLDHAYLACENDCFPYEPLMNWVTFIKRVGDDDPGITLVIWREAEGFYIQVDTTTRKSEHAESIRFCTAPGGGRSPTVLSCLRCLANMLKKGERVAMKHTGVGGQLKVYQSIDYDIWVKTENLDNDTFHGVKVFFPITSEIGPYFPEIMAAMCADLKTRPIH